MIQRGQHTNKSVGAQPILEYAGSSFVEESAGARLTLQVDSEGSQAFNQSPGRGAQFPHSRIIHLVPQRLKPPTLAVRAFKATLQSHPPFQLVAIGCLRSACQNVSRSGCKSCLKSATSDGDLSPRSTSTLTSSFFDAHSDRQPPDSEGDAHSEIQLFIFR